MKWSHIFRNLHDFVLHDAITERLESSQMHLNIGVYTIGTFLAI